MTKVEIFEMLKSRGIVSERDAAVLAIYQANGWIGNVHMFGWWYRVRRCWDTCLSRYIGKRRGTHRPLYRGKKEEVK